MQQNFKEQLISSYFHWGYTYQEITNLLFKKHDISVSIRQLKRILKQLGLRRKNYAESDLKTICEAVVDELDDSRSCLGYKSLWRRLQQTRGIRVKRDKVQTLLQLADPTGVSERSRRRLKRRRYIGRGPNFVWHIDGYDKIKPFKLAIHGAIDGFSRKVMWLRVAQTNNDPDVIAYYYLKTITKYNLLPTMLRSDLGTENVYVESLHIALRLEHNDKYSGYRSFTKGKSTSNQRIEAFWSQLRRQCMNFWMNFFKDMRDILLYLDSDPVHVECLCYCFGPLIQEQLTRMRKEWNRHKIRKQKNSNISGEKPNCMYYTPEVYGVKENYCQKLDRKKIEICLSSYGTKPTLFNSLFSEIIKELGLHDYKVNSPADGLNLYHLIIKKIHCCEH